MISLKKLSVVPCLMLITASLASAQGSRPASTATFENGYMTANAGAAFSSAFDQRTATFGVEIAERMSRRVEAYASFMYFDNLMTNQATADLAALSTYLGVVTGKAYQFSAHDRGLSFSGGAKYLISRGPTFRPYVGVAPGVLNLRRKINEQTFGDVTDTLIGLYGAPDGVTLEAKESVFKPFAEILVGSGVAAGRTYLDISYRYRKAFKTGGDYSFGQFNVGVGMRF